MYSPMADAPAEFAIGVFYLLRTESAAVQGNEFLDAARANEQRELAKLSSRSFGG